MRLLLLAILFLPLKAQPAAQSIDAAIRAVLDRQAADWNRGDVRAFMQDGYDNSPATLFIGSRVARGYQRVLENYLANYSTREKMGTLAFTNIQVIPLGPDHALAIGNFHLDRTPAAGGESSGIFTLTFEKKHGAWKIIVDHTSATK